MRGVAIGTRATAAARSLVSSLGAAARSAPAAAAIGAVIVLCAQAVHPAPASAQELPHPREMGLPDVEPRRPDPSEHRVELSNGLVAYVVEDAAVPLVTISAFVAAGSAREPAGAAAALAHAIKRGPSDQTPGVFRDQLRGMTAELRTEVTPERIEVILDLPAEDAATALDLLARTLRDPAVGPEDVEAVSDRVAEGYGRGYGADLESAVSLFRRHLYGDHPYGPGHRIAGAGLDFSAVRSFARALLVPGNTVVSIGGDLAAAEMRSLVEHHFGSWQGGPPPPPDPVASIRTEAPRTVHLHPAEQLQGWVVIGHELPPVPEEDRAALEVMNYILGGGHFDTRLFRQTRDRRGLTNDDSGFLEPFVRGPGTYTFRTYGRPGAVKLLVEITMEEIERIRSEPVTGEELFVAKGALADGVFADRYAGGWAAARSLALEWLETGGHESSATWRERIRAVTAEDVLDAARQYLHPDRMTIVVVGPLDEIRAAPSMEGEPALEAWGEVVRHGSTDSRK